VRALIKDAVHPSNDLMTSLVDDLKLSGQGSEFMNSGLSGVQIGRGLKPNRRFVILFSYDVVVVRFYGIVSLRLAQ
jgi:hypothetical protein